MGEEIIGDGHAEGARMLDSAAQVATDNWADLPAAR
jgi:hypothetical protein